MYHITVDGGALTIDVSKQFGTYTFTVELLEALGRIDQRNSYSVYVLEDILMNLPSNFRIIKIRPKLGFMPYQLGLRELIMKSDVFLALNQSLPYFDSKNTIAFCHGLSFIKYPVLYSDSVEKMRKQLSVMSNKARHIVFSSTKVANSFNDIYKIGNRGVTIPYGIPQNFLKLEKKYKKKQFILFVGMNHPIKNIPFLLVVFKELIKNPLFSRFKLLLVGTGSWVALEEDILPHIIQVPHTQDRTQLRQYFAEASCVVSTSLYESFNLPILESLSQGTPVVAVASAVVPELRQYVTIPADTVSSFVHALMRVLSKPSTIPIKLLLKRFSWDSYAKKVINLYDQV